MDLLLVSLGFCLMVLGLLGSFLPVLPGLPLSWIGLVLLYLTDAVASSYWILGITFLLTAIISVLDYVIPAQGIKRFGGSKYGIWGTNIGLVVGLIAPIPLGFVIGPFVGALAGELIYNASVAGQSSAVGNGTKRALKAATGSFIGFLASTIVKFVFCSMFLGLYVFVVWQNRDGIFGL